MNTILHLFDINTTLFTFIGYPMSYIEFFGTIFTIWCVWLTAKAKVLSWPVGIVGTVLYVALFYQIQLYSDLFEQVYFLISGFIGWWVWLHPKQGQKNDGAQLKVGRNTVKENVLYVIGIAIGTVILTYITSNLHLWLPAYFTEPAALPFLDAFTTVMSFVAQWLLVRKKFESWVLWILVDAIAIGLYWFKGVRFISFEYVLFLFIAIGGLINWVKIHQKEQYEQTPPARV